MIFVSFTVAWYCWLIFDLSFKIIKAKKKKKKELEKIAIVPFIQRAWTIWSATTEAQFSEIQS